MTEEEPSSEKQLKFVLVGAVTVGKTSLARRFAEDQYEKQYTQTQGVDFFMKRLTLGGGAQVTLQIWDTGGQVISSPMVDKYLFGAHAIFLVYDITSWSSFEMLDDWITVLHRIYAGVCDVPDLVLLANKCDLEHMRAVKQDKHLKLAQDHRMTSFWVSAKTGETVSLCFQRIAGELLGIKLTRIEQENVQPVVRAEIVQYPSDVLRAANQAQKTSVCVLQ